MYKPLHWWGDICFGPTLDGQATFRLSQWLPGSPDIDDAGRQAILWYLRAYGPATIDNLRYFFAAGLSVPGRRLTGWLTDLDDAITSVDVDGIDAYAATADLNELAATQPSSDIRLIPGYDPWVLGPGTADAWVVPRVRRADATRGANLILRGGGVIGTWKFARGEIHTNIYPDADPVSTADLNNSTARTLALLTA